MALELIFDWEWDIDTSNQVYSDRWYGQIWHPQSNFTVNGIAVALFRHATLAQCSQATMKIYKDPVCAEDYLGTLIMSKTVSLPALSVWDSYTWVTFPFDTNLDCVITSKYMFLLMGTAPLGDGEPLVYVCQSYDGFAQEPTLYQWASYITSSSDMVCTNTTSTPFKLYGFTVPVVRTDPATNVLGTSATLNGYLINDCGEACDCSFQWGLTTSYGNETSTQEKSAANAFSIGLTDLLPATEYHYRAKATNSYGTGYGMDSAFNTTGGTHPPPELETTRISSLVHRWSPGHYSLEMGLGGVVAGVGFPPLTDRPSPAIPPSGYPVCRPGEVLVHSAERGYYCAPWSEVVQTLDIPW